MPLLEKMIPFNKPALIGNEIELIRDAISSGKISGNGKYTKLCQDLLNATYGFPKSLLTTSCTDALEMAAILLDIKAGDEIIMPSYTFVSTANAFILRGANIVFVDSEDSNPNIDPQKIREAITEKTKAIVIVHYAGFACNMDEIMDIVQTHKLFLIEDAAQAIDNYYINGQGEKIPLGSYGHLSAFSFHETKNVNCGEGGLLVINDESLHARSEIIWEKGTNRSSFFRGEVDKYGWVDIGSSFLPSELNAAFLYGQLQNIGKIQNKRRALYERYASRLQELEGKVSLTFQPAYSTNNAHIFYILCADLAERTALISFLKSKNILAVFHYLPLHASPYYEGKQENQDLPNALGFSETLLRLPLFFELSEEEVDYIAECILNFYKK